MQSRNSTKFQLEQLYNQSGNDLPVLLEGFLGELEKENEFKDFHPDASDLRGKNINRNKRAVIERVIALWVLECKLNSYAGQSKFESS